MRFRRTFRSEKCIFAAKHRCEKPRASTRWWTRSTLAARRTATPSRPRSCRSLKRRCSFSSQSDYFGQQASGYLFLSSSTRRSSRSHLLISTTIVEQFGNCSNFFFLEFFQFTAAELAAHFRLSWLIGISEGYILPFLIYRFPAAPL